MNGNESMPDKRICKQAFQHKPNMKREVEKITDLAISIFLKILINNFVMQNWKWYTYVYTNEDS